MANLFRKEALEHQGYKLGGEVTLATHMSFSVITFLLIVIVTLGAIYLYLGEYQRKEVVQGYLRPTNGLDKVYTIAAGVIDEVFVAEGDIVVKGQSLVKIRLDRQLSSGVGANDIVIQELITQKSLLDTNIERQKQLFIVDTQKLSSQIVGTEARLKQAINRKELLQERLATTESKLDNIEKLVNKGFASKRELDDQREGFFSLKQQLEETETTILSTTEQLTEYNYELKQLPLQHDEQIGQLKSQLADINQLISQADSQRSFDVVSNRDGIVTSQLIKPGMVANTNQPMMTILPEDASLEAVLFVPTRAYGFVKENQETHIRYHAFPHQRFGIYEGEIVEVSKSVILPNETQLPVVFEEPVYRVVVKLKEQGAFAYGVSVPLQAGMLLEADILVDTRSLFAWLFEPIYSIRGSI
jgi:membrane fusion protein